MWSPSNDDPGVYIEAVQVKGIDADYSWRILVGDRLVEVDHHKDGSRRLSVSKTQLPTVEGSLIAGVMDDMGVTLRDAKIITTRFIGSTRLYQELCRECDDNRERDAAINSLFLYIGKTISEAVL